MTEKQRKKPGPKGASADRQDLFIQELLRSYGIRRTACEKAGVSRKTCDRWFVSESFRKKYDAAKVEWKEAMIAAGIQRATQKSDTLLMFFLKSDDPERFDDNIRRLKYAKEKGIELPENQRIVPAILVRDELPERLRQEEQYTNGAAKAEVEQ